MVEEIDKKMENAEGTNSPPNTAPQPPTQSNNAAPDPYANETDYEREQRLKLNADNAPHSGAIDKDIAKILEEVKLPERRDIKGSADPKASAVAPEPPKDAQEKKSVVLEKPQQEEGRDPVTPLHTLNDDIQDIVRRRKISIVRATALEQDKKRTVRATMVNPGVIARRKRIFAFLFASILLIVLGCAALYGVALVSQKRSSTTSGQYPSLLFAEQSETLPIDNLSSDALKQTIAQARHDNSAPLGSITRIIPTVSATTTSGQSTTEAATTEQFLTALNTQAPGSLIRALGDTFFFGIHAVDGNPPVLVIPVTDYDAAFGGMLEWESTMNQDLAPAFDAVAPLTVATSGLPTVRSFSDSLMLNYDVRVLKDDSGNVVLYYSFPTRDILIIAESPSSFGEILGRLQAQGKL
ncbi:MAG TPA: hypothetical protein VMU27_00035 [Candidatus Paceibacterota bacterium]|nr:hypothetical protein [Candidatus Paceibacterota bacterium]